jgi:small-conductance mechanosensitive channel
MDDLMLIYDSISKSRVISSLIIILIGIFSYNIFDFLIDKSEKRFKTKLFTSNKGKTYLKLMKSIVRYIVIIVTILIVLQVNDINVNSILAGVGIFGVIFGLAIQDWLKDIIRGSSIISDSYFEVGDIVKYKDIEGKVLVIGLKTTKIKELLTGNVVAIANRNIEEIQVVSNFIYVRVPMPYDVSLKNAEAAVFDIVDLIKENNNVHDSKYIGVTEFKDSSIEYLIQIDCNQQYKLQVRRDALRSILVGLSKHSIEIPFTQIDIHNK